MDDGPQFGISELKIGEATESKGGKETGRPGNAPPAVPAKDAGSVPALATKARTGFGKQLGRFGGAVSGRGKRNAPYCRGERVPAVHMCTLES